MPADVLDPTNAEINRVLLRVREQLRQAVSSGGMGEWQGRVPFFSRHLGKTRMGNQYDDDLTKVAGKS